MSRKEIVQVECIVNVPVKVTLTAHVRLDKGGTARIQTMINNFITKGETECPSGDIESSDVNEARVVDRDVDYDFSEAFESELADYIQDKCENVGPRGKVVKIDIIKDNVGDED